MGVNLFDGLDTDGQFVVRRAIPLIFGVFGGRIDSDGRRITRVGGSGTFVAPFVGLTAGHVSKDLLKLGWRGERPPTRTTSFKTEYSSGLFQFADVARPTETGMWQVSASWTPVVTDISMLQVSAFAESALDFQSKKLTYFDWALLPPPKGTEVLMLGFPETEIEPGGGDAVHIQSHIVLQVGKVLEVYEERRSRGFMDFPCFTIGATVDEGFSGGPILWGDRLCGIVSSGSSFSDETCGATLWPVCLLEYENPELGTFGGKQYFGEFFDRGIIRSNDWPEIKDRISKRFDPENDRLYAHIDSG
jgi:hypothetical protein